MIRSCLYPLFLFCTFFGWIGVIVSPFFDEMDLDIETFGGLIFFTLMTFVFYKLAKNHWTTKRELQIEALDWPKPLLQYELERSGLVIFANDLSKFAFCQRDDLFVFDSSSLVSAEVSRDSAVVRVSKRGGSILGGMIGGVAAGSTGALIGALGAGTTTTTETNFVKALGIKLILDGRKSGVQRLSFLDKNSPIDVRSDEAVKALGKLEEVHAKFQIMLKRQS